MDQEKLDEQELNDLADLIISNLKEDYRNDLEPFDIYAARVRARIHANVNEFRRRFIKGFHVLTEEIAKEVKP